MSGRPRAAVHAAMHRLLSLEAVAAHGHYTRLAHGRLFHLESGSGRSLVLLQGAGGGAANWYRLMRRLARGRRVLAPELPGFGISDPIRIRSPLGPTAAAVIAEWADRVIGAEPFDLVATSFGGLVALHLASRLGHRVERLVLLNSTGLGRGVCWPARLAGLRGVRALTRHPSRLGTRILLQSLLTSDRSHLPADHREALIDYLWRVGESGAGVTLADSLRYFAGPSGQRERFDPDALGALPARTLILWGENDRFIPARHGERAASVAGNASFAVLPRAGHSPNWEDPVGVLARIEPFLGLC